MRGTTTKNQQKNQFSYEELDEELDDMYDESYSNINQVIGKLKTRIKRRKTTSSYAIKKDSDVASPKKQTFNNRHLRHV